MIPQAGSAYAYWYATLGELIAWIIGWDLILEYAVGNIAVAIAWSGYFNSLLSGFGISLPDYLTHGYRTALLSSDPAVHGLLQTAPRIAGIPVLLNIPAALIVLAITWLLYIGVQREHARQQHHGCRKAARARPVRRPRRDAHQSRQLHAVRAERMEGHPPGRRDRVLRIHRLRRDLHRSRRDEEPAAQHADRHSWPGSPSAP